MVPPLSSPAVPSPAAERAAIVQRLLAELGGAPPSEEGFRRLIELYHHPVHRFFARRGFPPEDCLDLTQETFLGIYTGIRSFRGEAGFDTWVFTIAANACRKRHRFRSAGKRAAQEVSIETEPDEEPLALVAPAPAPSEEVLDRERGRLLREAIERMPEQMRKCLVLRVYQDLRYREIAAALRLSTETVKAHLAHARRRLQAELGDYFRDAMGGAGEDES